MSKVKTQIYGIKGLEDALMCCELGADHVGIGFGEVKHLGPNQKSCAEAKAIFDAMPEGVVKVGLTIATDVDEIIHDLSLCMPDVYHLSWDIRDISPEGVQRIRRRCRSSPVFPLRSRMCWNWSVNTNPQRISS